MADETTVYRGEWWLPDDEDNPVPGSLLVPASGDARLELIGGFEIVELLNDPSNPGQLISGKHTNFWPVVHGSAGADAFTLFNCRTSLAKSAIFGGPPKEHELTVSRTLKGPIFLTSEEESIARAVRVEIDYTLPWSMQSTLESSIVIKEDVGVTGSKAESRVGTSLSVKVPSYGTIELSMSTGTFRPVWQHPNLRVVSGQERSYLHAKSTTRKSLEHWDKVRKILQDLLTFCTDRPCAIRSTSYAVPVRKPTSVRGRSRERLRPYHNFEDYSAQLLVTDSLPLREIRNDSLIDLAKIPFELLLPRWFKLYDKATVPIQMLLGAEYLPSGYVGTHLMTACAALESLHRSLYDHLLMPKQEHKQVVKDARAGVQEPKHKQYVSERLYNSVGFKARASETVNRLPDAVAVALLGDRDGWAKNVRDARNDLAHANDGKPVTPVAQHRLLEVTQTVMRLVIAQELGLSEEQQLEYLSANQAASNASSAYNALFNT